MEELISWYQNDGALLHSVEKAALLHIIFVGIHPFIDGNGRTSRLLLNLELMKSGYPAVVIRTENRFKYYSALDKAHVNGNNADFIELICDELNNSLDLYLKLL